MIKKPLTDEEALALLKKERREAEINNRLKSEPYIPPKINAWKIIDHL